MSNIIIAGYTTEGSTDKRFLEGVIRRTFEDIAQECDTEIEVYDLQHIPTGKDEFIQEIVSAARKAEDIGVMVLCIHTDADEESDLTAFETRIIPAFEAVKSQDNNHCKNLVAVVPIQMTESWILADKELLKEEIGTQLEDRNLGIDRHPESITNPKEVIKELIRIAYDGIPRRRQRPNISELYLPIGQKIGLDKLLALRSYQRFKESVREAYRILNYLQ